MRLEPKLYLLQQEQQVDETGAVEIMSENRQGMNEKKEDIVLFIDD